MPSTVADVIATSTTGRSLPEMPAVRPGPANVGEVERAASVAVGGLLVGCGLGCRGWARTALPLLGGALAVRGITGWCAAYSALGIDTAGGRSNAAIPADRGVKVEEATTIAKPAGELFAFWRRFENLPRFLAHVREVREIDRTRSHWVADAPLGLSVAWDAEVINERPNELIAWRSLPGSQVDVAGSVHFTPAANGGGTEVKVALKYVPPAGRVGHAVAALFGKDPNRQIRADLRRFKSLMETGEIATIAGQSSGRR